MNRNAVMLVAVVLVSAAGLARAQELGVDLDATWVSKYLWRGFDLLDDKAAFQPSVNLDLYGTGFSANFWGSYPAAAGASSTLGGGSSRASRVDATEQDYTIAYDVTLLEDESYVTDVTLNYIYYDFIDAPDRFADAEEVGVGLAWPNLCPTGVVPSYYLGRIWPAKSNSDIDGDYAGWIHIFGLGYDWTIPGILPETPEQVISLGAQLVYNDGFNGGGEVDHDFSHATFGAAAPMPIGEVTFTPAVYWQASFDDSVNTENELYVGVSLSYSF